MVYEAQAVETILPGPAVATITITAASASADLSAYAGTFVYLQATVDTYVRAGATAPTATSSDLKLLLDQVYRFKVSKEQPFLAGLRVSADGSMKVFQASK